jgi:O-antigen/teichoic acid export membrane protein
MPSVTQDADNQDASSTATPSTHDLSPRAVRRRLGLNLISNVYNQGVTVVVQLLAIPLFLSAWGAEQYGVWVAINALPWYFYAISDLGFVNLATNEMTMARARGENDHARSVFHSTTVVVLAMGLLGAIAAMALAACLPLAQWLKVPPESASAASQALLILLAQLPLVLVLGLLNAGFRADGKYALGGLYLGTSRLLDGLIPASAALAGGGLVFASAAMFAGKVIALVVVLLLLRLQVPWLGVGVRLARRRMIMGMMKPALSFLAMPVAQALLISGTTLVVSSLLGPVAVATFNTIRTLGNMAFNAFGVIMTAMWTEISSLVGAKQIQLARHVNRRACNLSFWVAVLSCAFLVVAGEPILRFWTRDKVEMHHGLFYLQLLSIFVAVLWKVSGVVLLATNNHKRYTISYLVAAILQVLLTAATVRWLGLTGAGLAMVATEVLMLGATLRRSLGLIGESIPQFIAALLHVPRPAELAALVGKGKN